MFFYWKEWENILLMTYKTLMFTSKYNLFGSTMTFRRFMTTCSLWMTATFLSQVITRQTEWTVSCQNVTHSPCWFCTKNYTQLKQWLLHSKQVVIHKPKTLKVINNWGYLFLHQHLCTGINLIIKCGECTYDTHEIFQHTKNS